MQSAASMLTLAMLLLADPFRPVYHFTPQKNWMNDPNGLVYYKGEYHLFYQHNPFGNDWGHMSWGHAVSRDLVRWEHLPVALAEENGIMIFSGSAVVDHNNTSGFCQERDGDRSCLVAIYTGHTDTRQTQDLAYSNDRGRTWTKYKGNPVIDLRMKDFRDPKVIWHEPTSRWVMVAALPTEKRVRFFSSTDLKRWEALSDFGPAGATDGIWECPDLFPLGGRWVLVVNLNPGGVAGGSGGQYFVGQFDGKTFRNDNPPDRKLWIDYGKDMYATVSFSDAPGGRRVWLGWMSNWLYAGKEPTPTWRTAQSLPRDLRLRDGRILQSPVRETESLRGAGWSDPSSARGESLEIEAEIEAGNATEAGFRIRKGAGAHTSVAWLPARGELTLDRRQSGQVDFHKAFASVERAPLPARNGRLKLRIFVDRSSIEVFANDGEVTLTDRIFPPPGAEGVEFFSSGGAARLVSFQAWPLR